MRCYCASGHGTVAAGHPSRFILEFVEALDLQELGFGEGKSEEGRPSYSSDWLLKIWLYGYLGMVGMVCHAVDGTKVAAVASRRTVEHREDLEKLWTRVEAGPAEMEAAVEAGESGETGEYRLTENW